MRCQAKRRQQRDFFRRTGKRGLKPSTREPDRDKQAVRHFTGFSLYLGSALKKVPICTCQNRPINLYCRCGAVTETFPRIIRSLIVYEFERAVTQAKPPAV